MDGFTLFQVVINEEEQYSIWPKELDIPRGWNEVGFQGDKKKCLEYINLHWKDITPKSVRKKHTENIVDAK
ncbi:MbtH family protein [Fictibacillus nanhaiensis]|uniref:MbtH family protein n=1 Tax=Fictibacillus nanhaiensis TaxID=742169 RepID=UPI003C234072